MQMPPGARTGVLVVRLWREGEAGTPLKARITQTTDILTAENVVTTVGSVEEICAVVRAWAQGCISPAGSEREIDPPPAPPVTE
jgi:hypothetical protein